MGTYKEPWLPRAAPSGEAEQTSDAESSDGSFDSHGDSCITDPIQHLAWATSLPPPFQPDSSPLSPKQTQNLQNLAADPTAYQRHAMDKIEEWTLRKKQLEKANDHFRSTLSDTQRSTLGEIDVFLLKELIESTGHTDTRYVEDLTSGFPVTGRISTGNMGTPIPGGQ